MSRMTWLGQSCSLIGPMLLLVLSMGCSRPTPNVPVEGTRSASSFEDRTHDAAEEGPQSAALLQRKVVGNDLGNSEVLPPGTLLTVRLNSPLTAQNEGSNATFEAVVDEPVVVDGNILIPRGTVASGRVGQVRISNLRPDRGYVRLTLESLGLDGSDLPLQTANLFVRQKSGELRSGTIRLEKGRRLTFQLAEAFNPDGEHTSTRH